MQPYRLGVFLAFIAVLKCYELSQNLAEFYCVWNGNYSDREQVEKDGGGRTPINIRVQPVFAPALSKAPALYFKESTGGVLQRAEIILVTREEDNVIYLKQHNFTGNYDIKSGDFDANSIKSFTANDLQGQHDCQISFERVKPFVFFAIWPNCKQSTQQGKRGSYAATLTCNQILDEIPVGAPEKSTLTPYKIQHQGRRYPLENAPDNYVCKCDNTRDSRRGNASD